MIYIHYKHRPWWCGVRQLPWCSQSPGFSELVYCTLCPQAQELCLAALPGQMTTLMRHREKLLKLSTISNNLKTVEVRKHQCTSFIVSCFMNNVLYRIISQTFIFTFLLGIHKKYVTVFLFAVCIQKMKLSFQPLNFLKENDRRTKITRCNTRSRVLRWEICVSVSQFGFSSEIIIQVKNGSICDPDVNTCNNICGIIHLKARLVYLTGLALWSSAMHQ